MAGDFVKKFRLVLDADPKDAIAGLDHLGDAATKAQSKATASLDKISTGLTKVGTAGIAVAAAAGTGLTKLAGNFEDLALAANHMSIATGLSVEAASRWIEVSKDLGVETSTVELALGKLNKAAETTPQLFNQIGATIVKTKSGAVDVNATFLKVVDSLNAIQDPALRQTTAVALLGRGWQQMANIIGQGSADLTARLADVAGAKIVDDSAVNAAKTYRDELDHLRDSVDGLGIAIGKGAAPLIGRFADGLGAAVDAIGKADKVTNGAVGQFLALGTAAVGLVGGISLVAGQAIKMRDRFTDATGALNSFGTAAKGAAIGIGAIGIAITALQALDAVTQNTGKAKTAMDQFVVSTHAARGTVDETADSINALVQLTNSLESSKGLTSQAFDGLKNGLGHVTLSASEAAINLATLKEALGKIQQTSPQDYQQTIDALGAIGGEAELGNKSAQHFVDSFGLTPKVLADLASGADLATAATKALADGTDGAATAADGLSYSARQAAANLTYMAQISGPLSDNLNLVAEADKEGVNYVNHLTDATAAQNKVDQDRIDQTDRLVKSYQDQLDAVDKLRKGIDDEVSAALDANSAHLSSVDADQRVSDAIAKYNEMLRGTPPNLDDVAKAQDRLTKAKEKYNDSLKVTPASDLDKEKAQIALAEAQLAYTDSIQHPGRAPDLERRKATISLTEAQMAYDKVIKGSSASADEQAAALQDVTDAQKDYDATTRTVIHSEQDKKTAYEDVQRAINDSASTHAAEQEILKKEAGLSWNVRDSLDAQVTSLTNIEKTLAPGSALAVAVDAHIQQLKDQAAAADAAVASLNIYNGVPGGGAAGYGARVAPGGGVPHFATGGTVPGPVGQSMLALVHGGERVVPVGAPTNSASAPTSWSRGGTTSYSWTINVAPGTDTIAFGRIIEQARRDFLKAGGQAA
jgi:hypothetical protein